LTDWIDNRVTLISDGSPYGSGRHCGYIVILPFSVVGIPSSQHNGRDRLQRPTARANVETAHVLFHLACVLYHRPKRSDGSGRSPTVKPGRFAMPTSRAFNICINGVSGGDVQERKKFAAAVVTDQTIFEKL